MGVIQIQAQEVDSVPVMESQFVEIDLPKELNGFDYKAKYSDKSYQEYIDNYQVNTKKKFLYKFTKRLFDIIFALVMLAILSPVMVISSLAIIIEMIFNKNSRGSIFFVQKRMGKGGKVFNCLKFRTMKRHCNHDCATVLVKDVKNQYTKVGSFLRRFSLDEIPQLFCVLIGTMSLVGPRPVILAEENLNNMRAQLNVFSVRPGITGWAQVNGRDDVYYKNKAIMDAEYVKNASVWMDLKILFLTVKVVFSKKGVI